MEFEQLIIKGKQKNNMAKKIATKVNYQVTELVNNLNEAATTQSEQKRDFFTTRALYNAKRLSTILSTAKVGAMALILSVGMVACGTASTEVKADSTVVVSDSTSVDTTATQVVDTASVVK
jgi:acyl-coenzyme A synthetase/AMP-(fatty) acid ligase